MPSNKPHRDHTILVTNKRGHVRQVQRRDRRKHPAKDGRIFTIHGSQGFHPHPHWHFTAHEAHKIKQHYQRSGYKVEVARGRKYPWIILAAGAHWPTDHNLLRGINAAARDVGRRAKIISGKRTQAGCDQAWYRYQRGGPVAASPHGCGGHCCSQPLHRRTLPISGSSQARATISALAYGDHVLNALGKHNI